MPRGWCARRGIPRTGSRAWACGRCRTGSSTSSWRSTGEPASAGTRSITPFSPTTAPVATRSGGDGGVVLTRFRARDWDYLGWRYSLISSIAIAGWNNVIDMIPARDSSEHAYFSAADQAWFRHWIAWADTNREYLRHSRPILGQPAIGKIDGTAAMLGDHGFVFLFNPNARRLTATLTRQELGLAAGSFWLRELWEEGLGARVWGLGDTISISVEGESYRVLAIAPVGRAVAAPPAPLAAVSFNRQIGVVRSSFTGGSFAATFSVPRWVFDQLAARRRARPIRCAG